MLLHGYLQSLKSETLLNIGYQPDTSEEGIRTPYPLVARNRGQRLPYVQRQGRGGWEKFGHRSWIKNITQTALIAHNVYHRCLCFIFVLWSIFVLAINPDQQGRVVQSWVSAKRPSNNWAQIYNLGQNKMEQHTSIPPKSTTTTTSLFGITISIRYRLKYNT